MARLQAWLWMGGAVLPLLIAIIPHPPQANEAAFYIASAASAVMAGLLRWRAGQHLHARPAGVRGHGHGGDHHLHLLQRRAPRRLGERHRDALRLDRALLGLLLLACGPRRPRSPSSPSPTGWCWPSPPTRRLVGARFAQTVGTLGLVAVIVQTLRNRSASWSTAWPTPPARDPLTGLLNRRGFEETFESRSSAPAAATAALTVLVGDLDHFKRLNDRLGHPAGDAALERVGRDLRDRHRRIDTVARMGGEEFALILPETDRARRPTSSPSGCAARSRENFAGDRVPLTISLRRRHLPHARRDRRGALSARRPGAVRGQGARPRPLGHLQRARSPAR